MDEIVLTRKDYVKKILNEIDNTDLHIGSANLELRRKIKETAIAELDSLNLEIDAKPSVTAGAIIYLIIRKNFYPVLMKDIILFLRSLGYTTSEPPLRRVLRSLNKTTNELHTAQMVGSVLHQSS